MARVFEGTCRLCGERYTGTGISSHVKRCLSDHADIAAIHHGLLVGARADGPGGRFWMYLLVRPEASLAELDAYLREVWFRDDETVSAFEIDETQYLSAIPDALEEEDEGPPLETMDVDLGAVLRPRMECSYSFDPRHPTRVELRVFDPYPCPETLVEGDETRAVTLVARDEIDGVMCDVCRDPATMLRVELPEDESEGSAESEESDETEESERSLYFCEECAASYAGTTVRFDNSPRVGVGDSAEDDGG